MNGKAIKYAYAQMRKKARDNPCYLCEQVDCEDCEDYKKEQKRKEKRP